MIPEVRQYIEKSISTFNSIPEIRKDKLREIAAYIRLQSKSNKPANLTFICTHNSRRSHMSQIWAQTAAYYYDLPDIYCFSGGTEATAFNPRAVRAMRQAGFLIAISEPGDNPVYLVQYAEDSTPLKAFSKKYSDPFNPQDDYCAVMTCSDADEACPVVFGAAARVSIPYEDPKISDNTDQESTRYNERCQQIATEMLFLFAQVKN